MTLLRLATSLLAVSISGILSAQTTYVFSPIADTHIVSAAPDENFGDSPSLWIGMQHASPHAVRTLIAFDLSHLPRNPGRIRDARLSAWEYDTEPAAGGKESNLHCLISPWLESAATWNQQPDYDFKISATASVGDQFHLGWIHWNATDLVRGQASGSLPNFGWMLRCAQEDIGAARLGFFHSREFTADPALQPRLVVIVHDLELRVGTPLAAGVPFQSTVHGCTPSTPVHFFASRSGPGHSDLPGLGVVLDLDDPIELGATTSDASGAALFSATLPMNATGRLWIQSVQLGKTSNVVSSPIH